MSVNPFNPEPYTIPYQWYPYVAPHCDHCFCEEALHYERHRQCCKCKTRMAEQFIPGLLAGEGTTE
jgi:hypothetical protein